MKILVLIKQVPDTEAQIKIDSSGKAIDESGIKFVLNPYDEFGVEEAVRIKEKNHDSTVTAITIGPERSKEAMRSALAMGADTGIRIWDDSLAGADAGVKAALLAAAVKTLKYDIIFCGKQAIDDDQGAIGGAISRLLSVPFVSNVVKVDISGGKCILQREVEGSSEIVECAMPCIISAQKGLNEPRYPSLINIMKAKKKEIKEMTPAGLGVSDLTSKTELVGMEPPPSRPPGRIIEGEPAQAAVELVRILREEIKVF